MANPFNEARQERLKDDAVQFLKEFSLGYLKGFGLAMFEKIKREMEGEETDQRQLHYRPWDNCERPSMFSGEVYMKKGEGPGAFGKWKKVYLVERQDYNIDVFKDEKSYQGGKKPSDSIITAGYSLERDPSWHYRWDMRGLGRGLGLQEEEIRLMCNFSPFSWALAHSWRTNYLFQKHKGKDPMCPCFGGNIVEPEEAGKEFEGERSEFIDFMARCVNNSHPRAKMSVVGCAFDKTCDSMKARCRNLWTWRDDGTEAQMLVTMLMEQCLAPMRDDILGDLKGPVSMRLIAWYKTRGLVMVTVQKLADPAWGAMQKGADTVGTKIEPVIRKGVEPILRVKADAKDKIRGAVVDKMGSFLEKNVSPFLKPVFDAFDKPMAEGFDQSRETFNRLVDIGALPDDSKQRTLFLDNIPRTWDNVSGMRSAATKLVEPLRLVKKINDDIFEGLDPYALKGQAEMAMLTTLDAAVYTLECRMEEAGKDPALKADVLARFDHDVQLAKGMFMKTVLRGILLFGFKKAVSPITDPIIDGFNSVIPEDVQDFVSVQGLFDEIVDLFVGEPIEKMVDGVYPKP